MNENIDEYIKDHKKLKIGKKTYESDFGVITFIKDNSDRIILFEIYIEKEHRRKGICKNIILHCIENCIKIKKDFIIISVLSKILYDFLISFKCEYGFFKLNNEGFLFTIK